MSNLLIKPAGGCGFPVSITVLKNKDNTLEVKVVSACKMATELGSRINGQIWHKGIFGKMTQSVVYTEASACIKHVSCPVPAGLLKAIEVEVGAAVPADVVMRFNLEKDEQD